MSDKTQRPDAPGNSDKKDSTHLRGGESGSETSKEVGRSYQKKEKK